MFLIRVGMWVLRGSAYRTNLSDFSKQVLCRLSVARFIASTARRYLQFP